MEFTEIREADDIAAYARSFHVRKVTVDIDGAFHYSKQPAFDTFAHGERLEYEKALLDTPPNSASILLEKKQDDAISDIIGEDEPEENIMNDIQDSLREQSFMFQQTQNQSKLKTQKTVSFDVQEVVEQEDDENYENEENKNSGKTTDTITADQRDEYEYKKGRSVTQAFEKMDDDFISKSYMESRNLKSFLTARAKAIPVGRDGSNFIKRGEMKTFKVYFFTKQISLQVPVNISATVQEVIQQCLESFKANTDLDQALIKFPDAPEIYDLKASEDGLNLDKAREFKSIRTGRELFLIEPTDADIQARRNSKPTEEIILYQIIVHLPDEMRTEIPIELNSNSQLKEIYTCLAAQKITAYTSQFYNLRLYFNDPEKKFKEAKNYLDPSMPIKTLKNRIKGNAFELEFIKKLFADEPTEKRKQSDFMGRERSATVIVDNDSILHNPVSANRYEEYEVIKINESGKKQVRIMGIDGFKIYNYTKKYKEEPQGGGGMADMLLNMAGISKFGTMKPERLLTDVLNIKMLNPTTFQLEVKEDGGIRFVDYEVEDKKIANKIFAKIKYLKEIEKKNNPK